MNDVIRTSKASDDLTIVTNWQQLLGLIDKVWNAATESEEVPHHEWASRLINDWMPEQPPAHETPERRFHEGERQSYLKAVELSVASGMLGDGDKSDLLEMYQRLWPRAPSDVRANALKAGDQRSIDANALADAHRMYEAEHGHPFSESE